MAKGRFAVCLRCAGRRRWRSREMQPSLCRMLAQASPDRHGKGCSPALYRPCKRSRSELGAESYAEASVAIEIEHVYSFLRMGKGSDGSARRPMVSSCAVDAIQKSPITAPGTACSLVGRLLIGWFTGNEAESRRDAALQTRSLSRSRIARLWEIR